MQLSPEALRGYLDYLRDLGVYDLYRRGEPTGDEALLTWMQSFARAEKPVLPMAVQTIQSSLTSPSHRAPVGQGLSRPLQPTPAPSQPLQPRGAPEIRVTIPVAMPTPGQVSSDSPAAQTTLEENEFPISRFAPPSMPLTPFNLLAPLPIAHLAAAEKPAALASVRNIIGDCTRCPLAYAGRHSIVFADGDPNADLMFVGEGPGADEDASGTPFVGKAGQLLNNMIAAMGLRRESVYIANIVKCRPPKNRAPEPVEANTCSQFLLSQIDIVQPKVIVALGGTAATYLLGVKQPISALRGQWHDVRGAKCAVTYHPAFLLRDPRQKGEAWKDLQRVMLELGLAPSART